MKRAWSTGGSLAIIYIYLCVCVCVCVKTKTVKALIINVV